MSHSWLSRHIVVALATSLLFSSKVYAQCECGYSVNGETYTDAIEADFLHIDDISNDSDWQISNWPLAQEPYPFNYETRNVVVNPLKGSSGESANGGDPGLQLIVRGPTQEGANVSAAELATKRRDMHYGSYRAAIKYSREPGTCGSMFWEIDVELLSHEDKSSSSTSPVHFVLHAEGPSNHATPQLPFHPSEGYHEYRFDWSPGKVAYYVDGKHLEDLTKGVPEVPGSLILNHWSNGNPGWTQGPPKSDVIMAVAYVKAYFNTSSEGVQARGQCDAVCLVQDQSGPVLPNQETIFLTKHVDTLALGLNGVTAAAIVDGAAQRRPIADQAVNQHMVIVILVLRIGGPGATQPDTRIRFHGSAYG
ncbi:MAG: hypothetical protein LQ344_006665 [Seirophora lacunosa]|nr:MAG: hypothetical protein LQ344_006665 [Seirophora lacunosa]